MVNRIPTFNKGIDAYSYWTIEICLMFFLMSCLTLEALGEKESYQDTTNQKNGIQVSMIIIAVITMLFEILRAIINTYSSFKKKKPSLLRQKIHQNQMKEPKRLEKTPKTNELIPNRNSKFSKKFNRTEKKVKKTSKFKSIVF